MAIYERTVGVGGDFADWRLAWVFYRATPAAGHTYIFTQISDINQDATGWVNENNKDNETVIFRCPFADSHKGDPTRGFKTILAADAQMGNVWGVFASGNTIIVDGIYLERTVDNTAARTMLNFGNNNNTVIYRNLLIRGNGRTFASSIDDRGIGAINHYWPDISIYNCKIWDCGYALGGPGGTFGGPDGTQVVENVVVYNCDRFAGWVSFAPIIFRNVVVANPSGPSTCWGNVPAYANIMENCADTDGSLATVNGTATNSQMNIVAADEFQSLLDTDSKFLWLNNGEGGDLSVGGIGVPVRGRAPHEVQFTDQTIQTPYIFPGGVLADGGTAPTLSDVDIEGRDIPNAQGFYSIGCHQAQII